MQPTVYLIKCYDHKFLDFSEMNSTTCMLPCHGYVLKENLCVNHITVFKNYLVLMTQLNFEAILKHFPLLHLSNNDCA